MKNIFNNSKVGYLLLPFIGGLLFAAGFPMGKFQGFVVTPIIGVILLFLPLELGYKNNSSKDDVPLKVEILALLFFSLGYCILGYYWIPYTLKEFGHIYFPFNQVMGLLFSLIIGPHYLIFILGKRLVKKLNFKVPGFISSQMNRHLLFALSLSLLEHFIPQQFPGHLGQPWLTIAPYVGLAPHVGVPFFSFLSFWVVFSTVDGIKNKTWDKLAFIGFSIFMFINIISPLDNSDKGNQSVNNIRLVQANVGNFMKTQSENGSLNFMQEIFSTYERLSLQPTERPLDLIIWPETAYPRLLTSSLMKLHPRSIPTLFSKIIREMDSELLIGGYDRKSDSNFNHFESEYNSIFHFSREVELKDVYHKMKLIPFGEGLPFGPFNKFLSQFVTNVSYFAKGEEYTLFKTKNDTPFIAHICYEILFSRFTSQYLNSLEEDPQFIINLTNDSWYGDTSEPYQHLYLAHWRALEFNIPIVRMTNTGITSILYPDGSESVRTKIDEETALDIQLKTNHRTATLYQKFGILITLIAWLCLSILGYFLNRKTIN